MIVNYSPAGFLTEFQEKGNILDKKKVAGLEHETVSLSAAYGSSPSWNRCFFILAGRRTGGSRDAVYTVRKWTRRAKTGGCCN